MASTGRTYSLEEACKELHVSREELEEALTRIERSAIRPSGERITEEELNRVVDVLNDPDEAQPAAAGQ